MRAQLFFFFLLFAHEFFLLIWPIPALQRHSIKASSCVYLHYSSTHAFTSIIFPLFSEPMPCPADTWLQQLIERSYGPWRGPAFGRVKAEEPCGMPQAPQMGSTCWMHNFLFLAVDLQYNWKQKRFRAASLHRSAETICAGAKEMQLPKDSVKGKLFL